MLARIRLLFLLLLSILFNVGSAFPSDIQAQDEAFSDRVSAKINDAFDMALPGIRKLFFKIGLDPLELDDFHQHLSGILIHDGEFDLTNGWLQGITNIKRSGNVILSYEKNLFSLDMMLGLDLAEFEGDYLFKYGLIRRKGEVNGRLDNLVMRTVLSFDLSTHKIEIDFLEVISVGDIDIKLAGNIDDPLLNVAIKSITTLFRQHIMKVMRKGYEMIFQQVIDDINEKIKLPGGVQEGYNILDNIPLAFAFRDRLKFENSRDNTMRND